MGVVSGGKTHLIATGAIETKTPFTRSPVPLRDLRILSVYYPPMGTMGLLPQKKLEKILEKSRVVPMSSP